MAEFTAGGSGTGGETTLDTWGTKGYLVMEQTEALITFLESANVDDLTLAKFNVESLENAALRFLRARQFSVPNALDLLAKCVEKKRVGKALHFAELSADECVKCDAEALNKFYPHGMLGFDKFNRPILYEQSGRINPTAITTMTTYANLVNYHWLTMEKTLNEMFEQAAQQAAQQAGPGGAVISTCAVLDLEGLGVVHCTGAALDHVKTLIALDNICYPETLGKMFLINAPWLAVTTWEVVRGWLDPRTQAKIEIIGSGPEVAARLLQVIRAECLPARYGGTAPDWPCKRPSAEHAVIPRSSDLRRLVNVPAGHTLVVDSYAPEGEVAVEVYVSPMQFIAPSDSTSDSSSDKSTHSSNSGGSDGAANGVKLEDLVQLSRTVLTRQAAEGQSDPMRDTQRFPNPSDAPMSFLLRWRNPAMLVGRAVVINAYTEEEPLR